MRIDLHLTSASAAIFPRRGGYPTGHKKRRFRAGQCRYRPGGNLFNGRRSLWVDELCGFRCPVKKHRQRQQIMAVSIENRSYSNPEIADAPLEKGVYESCSFNGCDFSNADLSGMRFIDCTFIGCNLSLARLEGTSFRDVAFNDSKMLGLHFDKCGGFGQSFSFHRCVLDHSSFYKAKISHTVFRDTGLKEVDFTESDLTSAVITGCDCAGAAFERTILDKADLRTSVNYNIDPENNRLKKAKFSLSEIDGLLAKYPIIIDKLS